MAGLTDNPYPPGSSTPTNQPTSGEDSAVRSAASQAGEEAAAIKDEAVGAAVDVKERAVNEAASVAGEAREEARSLMTEVRGHLDEQADDATRRVASVISSASDELRSMAQNSDRPDGAMTGMVREMADRSAEVARQIETNGYQGIADELTRFGRNHAGLFLVAAGAAGFALGRILRNTDTQAVVQAARDELGAGSDTGTGNGRRNEAVLAETYTPVGSTVGAL